MNACVLAVEIHSRFALLNESLLLRNMDIYISRFFVYLMGKETEICQDESLMKGRFRVLGSGLIISLIVVAFKDYQLLL